MTPAVAIAERTLPHSLDAERAVLGAILIDNEAWPSATAIVDRQHFFRDAHRRIFERMVALTERHQPIELVTLKDALDRTGELEEAGGPAYIAALIDGVPRATNVEYYATIVREKAQLRNLIFSANKILSTAYEAELDADAAIDEAERLVMEIGRASVRGEFVLADHWFRETLDAISIAAQEKRVITGVETSLPRLDTLTRGLQRSDLIYIGARTSVGKTSVMLQMALHAADTVMAAVVSLEMSRRVIGMRAVAMEARVDLFRLMTGFLSDREQQYVGHALERLATKHLAIDDASGITITQLCAKVRRLAQRHGIGVVFIDYMQLIQGSRRAENRNLELSQISAALKALARDLDIPVVVLSQLSRAVSKDNRRPQLSDLRDSGALEQDADVVILLHRPQQSQDGEGAQRYQEGEEAELILAKQRNGPTGVIKLRWKGEQVRFVEADSESVEQPRQESLV